MPEEVGRPQTGKKFTAKVAVSQFLSHVGIGKHPFFLNIFQKLLQYNLNY